jgi:hypothetical protein
LRWHGDGDWRRWTLIQQYRGPSRFFVLDVEFQQALIALNGAVGVAKEKPGASGVVAPGTKHQRDIGGRWKEFPVEIQIRFA